MVPLIHWYFVLTHSLTHSLSNRYLYLEAILFMVLSKDSKGLGPKKNVDPDKLLDKIKVSQLTRSLTYSLPYSLTYSLTHLLTHL